MYHANQMFVGIMLKGYGVGTLSFTFLVVIGMEVLFFVLALSDVKDRMD